VATREAFLAALRKSTPRETPPPDLSALGVRFPDPAKQFADALASVGGAAVRVPDRAAAHRAATELPVYRQAKRIVSLVPGVGEGNVALEALADPHALEGLDVAILPGQLAVAENGAVWVDGAAFHHRVVFVVPEHLVLVVDAANVVNDMHEAYARLDGRPIQYGLFISGPSKTADIEQALVIGAQGARSCTVVLVG
jgi:L-lactate dehydrogenase complex protein LldG